MSRHPARYGAERADHRRTIPVQTRVTCALCMACAACMACALCMACAASIFRQSADGSKRSISRTRSCSETKRARIDDGAANLGAVARVLMAGTDAEAVAAATGMAATGMPGSRRSAVPSRSPAPAKVSMTLGWVTPDSETRAPGGPTQSPSSPVLRSPGSSPSVRTSCRPGARARRPRPGRAAAANRRGHRAAAGSR
jgi:hypothetical protein